MSVASVQKPMFTREQIVPASVAAKRFAEIRNNAKTMPQFISDHNEIDAVVLGYEAYESMYMELQYLREQQFYATAARRIHQGDADPKRQSVSLCAAMDDEEFSKYLRVDADAVSDEDLFE